MKVTHLEPNWLNTCPSTLSCTPAISLHMLRLEEREKRDEQLGDTRD